jgi:hypothetical protein
MDDRFPKPILLGFRMGLKWMGGDGLMIMDWIIFPWAVV